MKTWLVEVGIDSGHLQVEVIAADDTHDVFLLDAAVRQIESELSYAKLRSAE
jgi:hypothetical protein